MSNFQEDFLKDVNRTITELNNQLLMAERLNCEGWIMDAFSASLSFLSVVVIELKDKEVKVNYLHYLGTNLPALSGANHINVVEPEYMGQQSIDWREKISAKLLGNAMNSLSALESMKFNFEFFEKIGFYSDNVVVIGANGSGKSRLSRRFRKELSTGGLVIAAQRILRIPKLNTITSAEKTFSDLKASQSKDKFSRTDVEINSLQQEFELALKNLFSQQHVQNQFYRNQSKQRFKSGMALRPPDDTLLDRTISIWNRLLPHREISCRDGMNVTVSYGNHTYAATEMSDGEKAVLFLIAQVLQAPQNGFIVVDEPETFLHKTVLKRLWDILEHDRRDCLFIYLTHDLDFAVSRGTAKKIWVKSYIHPDQWEIEPIPDNEIPEALMLELLGSRRPVLFCEGERGKVDERMYSLLFPGFVVTPVGSCHEVISHTRAFNKIQGRDTQALGLIDADFHDADHLSLLEKKNVFHFTAAEVENLFFDEAFLRAFEAKMLCGNVVEGLMADIVSGLEKDKEVQVSNYLAGRINYYFQTSHLSRAGTLKGVKDNLANYLNDLDIERWYKERMEKIEGFLTSSDYPSIIQIYNNKGLVNLAHKHFNLADFRERAFRLLAAEKDFRKFFYPYFPESLVKMGCEKNNS